MAESLDRFEKPDIIGACCTLKPEGLVLFNLKGGEAMLPHGLLVVLAYIVGGAIGIKIILWMIGIVVIGSDEMGIVEKRWSRKGSVKEGQIIALEGQAGYQPAVLRTGLHLLTPIFYTVKKRKLITIGRGKIGYVFARDGKQMPATQLLGKAISVSFEDCAAWLKADGQKGLNRGILREGTYAINTAAFAVLTENGRAISFLKH